LFAHLTDIHEYPAPFVQVVSDKNFVPPPEPPFEVLWAVVGDNHPNFTYGTVINFIDAIQ
jgi:hypothetical protein